MDEATATDLLAKKSFTGAQSVLNRIVEVSGLADGFQS
jgi:hypothetical protein